MRLCGEKGARHALIGDAIPGQALLQEPGRDSSSAHTLAKSWIERARGVGDRDEPVERNSPALIMPPSVPRCATGVNWRNRFHAPHHLVHDRGREMLQRRSEIGLAARWIGLIDADVAQQPALVLDRKKPDEIWPVGRSKAEEKHLPPPVGRPSLVARE